MSGLLIGFVDSKANADIETIKPTGNDTAPSARVGSAMTQIGKTLYLFSGRGGVAMAPVDEQGAVWFLDASSSSPQWNLIKPSSSTFPEARSYHAITSNGKDSIYIHAGCPESGRLSDLWSFSIPKKEWKQLASAPDPPRGGTSIAFAEGKIWRTGGFDGKTEQGGAIDVFDPSSNLWSTITFSADGKTGPGARSVAALVPVNIPGRGTVLVSVFGESDPSSLGHQGAGKMLSDAWGYEIQNGKWAAIDVKGEGPEGRGWFDADIIEVEGKDGVVVSGGLGESNERLDDLWILRF